MKILFHRYGSICEPDIISVFQKLEIEVLQDDLEISQKNISPEVRINTLLHYTKEHILSFVFSLNYFPYISDFCNLVKIPYVCWTVDSPVLELFSKSIYNPYNRLFLFDYAQYQRFHRENPACIFYLPLATNCERWDAVLQHISEEDRWLYGSDISFVGSLYTEKSPLEKCQSLSPYTKGFLDGLVSSQAAVPDGFFLEELLPSSIVNEIKESDASFPILADSFQNTDAFVTAHSYLGMKLAAKKRAKLLDFLAASYKVKLYTRSDPSALSHVTVCPGVKTLTEMPKVFHLSKINLNITIPSIETGLSLRVWDILGCGGFLLTNYQAEIPEYFEIGTDLEIFTDTHDLADKVAYYLAHEEERLQIAQSGYRKVKALHTYESRIIDMLRILADWSE